jgi:hypothetical protein
MNVKSLYLDNRKKLREQLKLANDFKGLRKLENGFKRFKTFSKNWQVVDVDEIVNKLFKNPILVNNGQKFEISEPGSKYIIHCDNGGSYFRIGDTSYGIDNIRHYLTLELIPALNETVNGRTSGIPYDRKMQLTHFKMKIKRSNKK